MNLGESILVAWEGLVANKLRSALTMLGVVIGVGAVITMLALGRGAREQNMQRIEQMGTNVLFVMGGRQRQGSVRGSAGSGRLLKLEDVDAVIQECPSVLTAAPEVQNNAQVKYLNQNTNTTVLGTSPEYLTIRNTRIADGRMFTAEEVSAYRRVAVIGPTTATTLFGDSSPVGQMIRIRGSQFEVIGLLATKGTAGGFFDPDDQIIIPVTTAMRRIMGTQYIRSISVQARSMEVMDQANTEVDTLLRARHKIDPDDEDAFRIMNQAEIIGMLEETNRTFTLLLAGIASVSLLVGGIGIMNIMLVSVTERTREIGIRKALGARARDIQRQFLIEALVLSLFGGIVGIVAGMLGALVLNMLPVWFPESMPEWHTSVSMSSIFLSFAFAVLVGIFFGYYPAVQASRLNPIEALRYE